jgi:hypothetical protein
MPKPEQPAAPPDDGGRQGVLARPEDEIEEADPTLGRVDQVPRGPNSLRGWLIAVAVLALVVVVAYLQGAATPALTP